MRRIFLRYGICIMLFLSMLSASDPITIVQYPLLTRPIIQTAGGDIQIECKASSSTSGWQAKLYTDFNEVNLSVNATYNSTTMKWLINASIPADAPFELYSLELKAGGSVDQVKNAVKIIREFKNDYYFIHIPDLHLPHVSWIGFYDDNNTIPEFLKIFKELELINPEFVLQTGDIVENGREEEHYQIAKDLLSDTKIPIFATGGNHDLWYSGHDNWEKYFNPIMDYSFNYGKHHYSGMEMFDLPTVTFTAEQMEWIQTDLQESMDNNDDMRIMFYHYDESRQIDGDFVDDNEIDLILYGHTHINGVQTLGNRATLNINTSFTMDDNGQYRIIKISDNQVTEYPILEHEKLGVAYSTANDGTNWKNKAHIRNTNPVDFENGLLKFFMQKDASGYTVSGGTIAQVIESQTMDVYYVDINIPATSEFEVTIESNNPPSNDPPEIITYSPILDPVVYAGNASSFSIQATDPDNSNLTYSWYHDGVKISSATGSSLNFATEVDFTGITYLKAKVSDGEYTAEKEWMLEVQPFTDKPVLTSLVSNFFGAGDPITLEWFEPFSMNAKFQFGITPGVYTNSIDESGSNSVTFTPEMVGMGLGKYYCRISDGSISSDVFTIIIESSQAPKMTAPIGNILDLSPRFTWERVQGVPYYMIVCSDQEIIITENEDGEIDIEGANPIWSVLTSSTNVPYGIPDPTGTFTSSPAPLIPGNSYWWIVLNCYGNTPELASAVQSGVSKFTIDVPLPDMDAPILVSPTMGDTLSAATITFHWSEAKNASMYHFYPFKIEEEMGIEMARGIWEDVIATTETSLDFAAGDLLQNGRYRWKVASVAENGIEIHSTGRDFVYTAPAATISLKTYDSKNTSQTSDDKVLPRVNVNYTAIDGISSSLPLSTDLHGSRANYSIAPGTYAFSVEKDGYDNLVDTLTFTENQVKTVYFRLNPSKSKISGKVVDNLGNKVSDAQVFAQQTLHPEITKRISTDALGSFSMSVLPGSYQIIVSKTDYETSAPVSFSIDNNVFKQLDNDIVLIKNSNTISGNVVNTAQQSVLNAKVTLSNASNKFEVKTDNNGVFQFIVANGTWKLNVSKEGFVAPEARTITVSGGSNISVSPPLQLAPNAAIITGVVSDGLRLVSKVNITAYPAAGDPYITQSDGTGNFTLNVLPGTYTITGNKQGYIENSVQVSMNAGATMSGLNLEIEPIENTIAGKTTSDGYTPVDSATVGFDETTTYTNEGGIYKIGMNAGTYILRGFKEGYTSSAAETLSVTQGMNLKNVDFILTPNASVIKGNISSANGKIRNAEITAYGSQVIHAKSDDNGKYVLNLKAGAWYIVAGKTGFLKSESSDSILVGIGQTVTDINFVLAPNIATINGIVTNSSNNSPIRNATISIPEKEITTETSSSGEFTLVVEPAEYQIEVFKQGFGLNYYSTGTLTASQTKTLNISLQELQSQFIGKIINEDGTALGNISIMAISSADTFRSVSKTDGSFTLDVESGTYTILISNERYKTVTLENQTIGMDAILTLPDFKLILNLGNISGVALSNEEQTISLAKLVAKHSTGFSTQTSSNDKGEFDFLNENNKPTLKPGVYKLIASKTGFQPDTLTNIIIEGNETITTTLNLIKNLGKLSGTVRSDENAIANATIEIQSVANGKIYNAVSLLNGKFAIENIPPGEYKIKVSKKGFSSPASKTVNTGDIVELILTKNNGRVLGKVVDKETKLPLKNAIVFVDDNKGNNGSGLTDSLGFYYIEELPRLNQFTFNIKKRGYATQTNDPINVTDSLVKNFELQRFYSDVNGQVLAEDETVIEEIMVYISSKEGLDSILTGSDGRFSFSNLPSNDYILSVKKIGFNSSPYAMDLSLWDGQDVADLQFTMKEAKAATISIIGPDEINNNAAQQYTISAQTDDFRNASVDVLWELDEDSGNNSISNNGLLTPSSNFIGVMVLTVTDAYSGVSISKDISVYQNLSPENADVLISNQKGVSLEIPGGSVQQNVNLQLKVKELALIQKSTKSHEIIGEVYQISPENVLLMNMCRLTLPVDGEQPLSKTNKTSHTTDNSGLYADVESYVIGKWDTQWLEWQPMEDGNMIANSDQISIDINQLGRYCVMAKSDPIGIKEINLTPNPFSPITGPLQISYILSSDQTAQPMVTIKIYNMNGDLVKKLLSEELQPRGENLIEWDGKTDNGSMANNGRYMMQFVVRDTKGKKEKIKLFVLIK